MSGAQDVMVARLQAELEERSTFQDGLVEAAQKANRDLNETEMDLYQRASERITAIEKQITPLREGLRNAMDSRARTAELQEQLAVARNPNLLPKAIEYRSAGEFIIDAWRAQIGHQDAQQ